MIVALAATQLEMAPFLAQAKKADREWPSLVTGVGPMETAVRLGRFLAEHQGDVTGLLQFGVGGGYCAGHGHDRVAMLDVCLASTEVLGDFGVCLSEAVEGFPEELGGGERYELDPSLTRQAAAILMEKNITAHIGNFITVNSVSGTAARGNMLANRFQGLCENMEGAAAARLSKEYGITCAELRVISNMVEDRNTANWRLIEAAEKAGMLAAEIMRNLK